MILKTDPSQIQSYLSDVSSYPAGRADGVAIPSDEKEISDFLANCSIKKIPVTISGGGTGTVGGRIPYSGFVLSTELLNRIIMLEKDKAVLGGGVLLEDFQKEVEKSGLFYPPDSTEQLAALGGNVATNASGARSFFFGSTRNFVTRIKVVLSSGRILDIQRGKFLADASGILRYDDFVFRIPTYPAPKVKNAAGYFSSQNMDLIDLFIGSEGTLGVIYEIEVKLLSHPKYIIDYVAFFKTRFDACNFVYAARKVNDVISIEYMDKKSLDLLRPDYPSLPDSSYAVLFEEKCNDDPDFEKWMVILEKNNSLLDKVWVGDTLRQKKIIKDFRHRLPEILNDFFSRSKFTKISTDIAVPADKLVEMMDLYERLLEEYNLDYVIFAHIGQNHLHMNILPKNQQEYDFAKKLYMRFIRAGIGFKGTVSAEHGIGKLKRIYLKEMVGDRGIAEMVRVKKEFDPACILGRGNIFDESLLN